MINLNCPNCGELSTLTIGPTQAFCTNTWDDCNVVTFNPSLPDGGLSEANEMKL